MKSRQTNQKAREQNPPYKGRPVLGGVRLASDAKNRTILARSAKKLQFTASNAKTSKLEEISVVRVEPL